MNIALDESLVIHGPIFCVEVSAPMMTHTGIDGLVSLNLVTYDKN